MSDDLIFNVGESRSNVPAGIYKAVVDDIQKSTFKGKRDTLIFLFRVVEGQYRDSVMRGFVNTNYKTFSGHTKLFQWHEKATGRPLQVGEQIKMEDFKNVVLNVNVESKESKTTKNKFPNVTEILSLECRL